MSVVVTKPDSIQPMGFGFAPTRNTRLRPRVWFPQKRKHQISVSQSGVCLSEEIGFGSTQGFWFLFNHAFGFDLQVWFPKVWFSKGWFPKELRDSERDWILGQRILKLACGRLDCGDWILGDWILGD